MHREYFAGFHDDLPYPVIFVQLDEGPFLISDIVGGNSSIYEVGARVEVVFDRVTDEFTFPRFRPI
jgi:hypothetical protein